MNEHPRQFERRSSGGRRLNFLSKIESRTVRVAVIGLGYVGLPLVLGFDARRLPTLGVDVDQAKVDLLAAGRSYIRHIADKRIADMIGGGIHRND